MFTTSHPHSNRRKEKSKAVRTRSLPWDGCFQATPRRYARHLRRCTNCFRQVHYQEFGTPIKFLWFTSDIKEKHGRVVVCLGSWLNFAPQSFPPFVNIAGKQWAELSHKTMTRRVCQLVCVPECDRKNSCKVNQISLQHGYMLLFEINQKKTDR